jgi:tetraacyldisaccharide 4'-kinase
MIKVFLYLLSRLYGLAVYIRNLLFDLEILKSKSFKLPVISVGNLTVGGTGKTPHVEYLVSLLNRDYNVATLSRGYKRKSKGYKLADIDSDAYDIGDEPKQLKNKFPEVHVAVDNKRAEGVEKLQEQIKDLDIVLLDDAFQHRYIKPGLSILLVDYNRPIYKDYLLPYGRLRESMHEKRRANIIIVTKTPRKLKPIEQRIISKNLDLMAFQSLFFTTLKYGKIRQVYNLFDIQREPISIRDIKSKNALLVTGIAQDKPLLEYVNKHIDNVQHLKYNDHHFYTHKDIAIIHSKFEDLPGENKIILTTEKDAIRFRTLDSENDLVKSNLHYIPLKVDFLMDDREKFEDKILKYVKKLRKSSKFYQIIY